MCRIQSWCRMIQSICGQRQGRMNISFTWTSKRHLRRAPFHVRWGLERRAKALSRSPWRPSVTTSSSSFEGTRAGCWCWSECHGSPFDGPVFLSPHSFSGVCGTPACVRDMRWGFHVEPTDVVPFSATISLVSCCWFSFQGSPGSLWFVELWYCFGKEVLINEESFVINDDDELVVSITAAVPATKASQNKHVLLDVSSFKVRGPFFNSSALKANLSTYLSCKGLSVCRSSRVFPNPTFCGKPWLKAILFISFHLLFYFGATCLLELPHAAEISVIIVVIVMFDFGIQELTKNDPAAEAACREWGSWCCDLGCQHKSEFGIW